MSPGMICLKGGKVQPKQAEGLQEQGALLPAPRWFFPVRITYPVNSLLFENSQAYCPAELGRTGKTTTSSASVPVTFLPCSPGREEPVLFAGQR